ncbi:MAG: hypothetical protein ABSG84_08830 [Acidobacteriaceae bacterium]
MLFRKHIVSTRALLQLTVAMVFFVGGVGTALAGGNTGIAPLLVPYTITTIAGTPQFPTGLVTAPVGFAGEGAIATPSLIRQSGAAVLNAPFGQAVDSAGNVYITDTGNDVIREVNAQTGLITTIAGVFPKGCSGQTCTVRTSGCANGVPAAGNPIGGNLAGIAVDAYGNVYYDDATQGTISVIYRGGAQVAAFIALVNPEGVKNSGGTVLPGYVYYVAGTINLSSCTGTLGSPGPDNSISFEDSSNPPSSAGYPAAQLHGDSFLSLDSAGNIYEADTSNSTIRVINTQATTQTFFQYQVAPGYMKALTGCGSLTIACATVYHSGTTTSTANTGINGPINSAVFNSQYREGQADAWGNLYQLNGTGSGTGPPGIYGQAGYAGGAPLTNLLTVEAPLLASSFGPGATPPNSPAELPLTYGNAYVVLGNPAISSSLPGSFPDVLAVTNEDLDIRPSSLLPDTFGTFWFNDNHYPEIERVDQYTGLAVGVLGSQHQRATASVSGIGSNFTSPATFTNPWYCVYGASGHPWTSGPQTYDPQADGCPSILAYYSGGVHYTVSDGLGNIYIGDGGGQLVRELVLGTVFPATAVGTLSPLPNTCFTSPCGSAGVQASPVVQPIQVHFNSSNPPVIGAAVNDAQMTGNATSSFSINSPDFSIDTTDPEFPMGSLIQASTEAYAFNATTANFNMWSGLPTCTQLGAAPIATVVQDYDCLVYVSFNPSAPGVRQAQLKVTTNNGSVYNFPLYGVGVGAQLAVDGGTATQVPATGLGTTAGIAVSSSGIGYIADPVNNRVVSCNPASTCAAQSTIGTGLKNPMGVAVDTAGNVYISDTGNNRVLEVNPLTSTQTVLGNNVWVSGDSTSVGSGTTPPPQYAFKAPQGLAVDVWNNVYVADTGNSAVVEIPSNNALGGAVPLLSYPGAPKFKNPVAVAVDSMGNIYVADTKNPSSQIIVLPPGGGDLVTVPGTSFPSQVGSGVKTPNGVAVDGAGNLYVSDATANTVVEIPSASGPGSTPFALNFVGMKAPAGVALDQSGNLYVADTGNSQVLFDNRQNPVINFGALTSFGNVPQDLAAGAQPVCSGTIISDGFNIGNTTPCVLTVTNIGNQAVTLGSPFLTTSGGNAAYSISNNCASPLPAGLTCTITPTFTPTADGGQSENVSVNAASGSGSSPQLSLQANGEQPLVNIVLTSSLGATPAPGGTDVITATVTQPHLSGVTPTGNVVFTYAVDVANSNVNNCGAGGTQTVALTGSGGTATASFNLPSPLAAGVQYTVSANYTGDTLNTPTQANPILVAVQAATVETATVTSTAAQLTFTYGSAAPVPVGSVAPALPTGVTASFGSAAKATTPIGSYPVVVSFSGTGACGYGFPPSVFSGGGAAVVQENAAPLTYAIPNFTALYGAPNISYGQNAVITGAQNGDGFGATFTPAKSSVLNVGSYSVVPTVLGANVGDYIVTAKPSTLTISKAGTVISVSLTPTSVANTAAGVATVAMSISVATTVAAGIGTPTGSVTLTDAFTLINATGLGATTTTTVVLPLTAGAATYTPTNATAGLHQYTFAYSGDSNFQTSSITISPGAVPCSPSALAVNCLLVDYPDFTLTSTTGPVTVIPGVVPSGNGLLPAPNQSTAAPETAVLFVNGVLGFAGQVTLSCAPENPSYVSCFMTPPAVSVTASSKTAATVVAIETPATLPLGFKLSELRTSATRTVLAFLPFGLLAFCVRRRRRLSKALWILMIVIAIGAGMTGCGGNQVDFYTAVPTGPQTVTVNATWQGSATQPAGVRSFVVPINID